MMVTTVQLTLAVAEHVSTLRLYAMMGMPALRMLVLAALANSLRLSAMTAMRVPLTPAIPPMEIVITPLLIATTTALVLRMPVILQTEAVITL